MHRDLKLENLLLAQPGDISVVKIADFGLAKQVGVGWGVGRGWAAWVGCRGGRQGCGGGGPLGGVLGAGLGASNARPRGRGRRQKLGSSARGALVLAAERAAAGAALPPLTLTLPPCPRPPRARRWWSR